jgi:hypothetical protein
MSDYRLILVVLLIASGAFGCDRSNPEPIWFEDLDGGADAGGRDASTPASPGGGASAGTGAVPPEGEPITGPGGAPGGAPMASPFTCPNCAGLCLFGFCLGATPPPPTDDGDDDQDDADDESDESGMAGAGAGGAECGDEEVEEDETCDPPESCPSSCDDDDSCTVDESTGDRDSCDFACEHTEITDCEDDDGCCASGCDANEDSDCEPICGNDVVEDQETCDPPGSCPDTCDDAESCTVDMVLGDAESCTLACGHTAIDACGPTEGCCPSVCGPTTDVDCPGCGNARVEPDRGETCDPPATCLCDDEDACTVNVRVGTPSECNVNCTYVPITTCSGTGDGCCPSACTFDNDADCDP